MKPKIVLTGKMAGYPQGGGHWSVHLQYLLGLQALGQDFVWLELLQSRDNRHIDERLINVLLSRFRHYGLESHCIVALYNKANKTPELNDLKLFNINNKKFYQIIDNTDILFNFYCSMRNPILSLFARKALLDLDPGHLQVSSMHWDMNIDEHDIFFTVGLNINGPDCEVPNLGKRWYPFLPPIFLPSWSTDPKPSPNAPFTSITQWTWGEGMWLGDRLLSVSKRDAYLRFIKLPTYCKLPLELAVNIDKNDDTGDREMLRNNGWRIASPHRLTRTPKLYQKYILRSRGEIGCAKPIHADLRTGWFSDRSAAYLASGRPVIIEDTGVSVAVPVGNGILTFNSIESAREQLEECAGNYESHSKAARMIAEEYLDSRKVLSHMIEISMSSESST